MFVFLLTVCFVPVFNNWVRFAVGSELFSYVLLVPLISSYLVWIQREG